LSNQSLKIFVLYLENRKQCVNIKNHLSDTINIKCGVPQGSILGPLLFNLYINDIHDNLDKATPYTYADDAVIIIKSKSKVKLLNKILITIKNLTDYYKNNCLTINTNKTSLVFLNKLDKDILFAEQKYLINNNEITIADNFKYLGYHIENSLSFKKHNQYLINKLSSASSILTYSSKNLPKKYLFLLLNSLAISYLNYSFLL
jgi:ribonuclease P/MRP protein subunit RPP40